MKRKIFAVIAIMLVLWVCLAGYRLRGTKALKKCGNPKHIFLDKSKIKLYNACK